MSSCILRLRQRLQPVDTTRLLRNQPNSSGESKVQPINISSSSELRVTFTTVFFLDVLTFVLFFLIQVLDFSMYYLFSVFNLKYLLTCYCYWDFDCLYMQLTILIFWYLLASRDHCCLSSSKTLVLTYEYYRVRQKKNY